MPPVHGRLQNLDLLADELKALCHPDPRYDIYTKRHTWKEWDDEIKLVCSRIQELSQMTGEEWIDRKLGPDPDMSGLWPNPDSPPRTVKGTRELNK